MFDISNLPQITIGAVEGRAVLGVGAAGHHEEGTGGLPGFGEEGAGGEREDGVGRREEAAEGEEGVAEGVLGGAGAWRGSVGR